MLLLGIVMRPDPDAPWCLAEDWLSVDIGGGSAGPKDAYGQSTGRHNISNRARPVARRPGLEGKKFTHPFVIAQDILSVRKATPCSLASQSNIRP